MNTFELPSPPQESVVAAHRALMKAFEPMKTYCSWIDAPFGRVFLAKTSKGVCRITFRRNEDEILTDLERRSLLPEMAPDKLSAERRQLEEYFGGKRKRFDLPIDLRVSTPFERKVLETASRIPFGECQCYSDVARRMGRPKAQRAVGNALGKNPIAIVIPCHRVVGSGGKIGGYTGGLDIKRSLMGIEGIRLEDRT